ncbi:MAG: lytic transglycosylase domain-containing protein [Peptococcales bacterium]
MVVINSDWFLKIFYPISHQETVLEASKNYDIDEFLIWAIIRVESKFDTKAQSSKGARGLMQVLPDTGRWIAQEMGYTNFHPDLLYEPRDNINIGTWYLKYLLKQFNGNLIAAIAAYNGGETNVKKWLNNDTWSGSFNDISSIPFKETRNYVYKVIVDYETYRDLYSGK